LAAASTPTRIKSSAEDDSDQHRVVELEAMLAISQHELQTYRTDIDSIKNSLGTEFDNLKERILEMNAFESLDSITDTEDSSNHFHDCRNALTTQSTNCEGLIYELNAKIGDSSVLAADSALLLAKIARVSESKKKSAIRVKRLEEQVKTLQAERHSQVLDTFHFLSTFACASKFAFALCSHTILYPLPHLRSLLLLLSLSLSLSLLLSL
jgi:hypothetical protein